MILRRTLSLALAAAAAFSLAALRSSPARAQVEVSAEVDVGAPVEVDTFHTRLASSGRWIHVNGYGDEVWVPAGIHEGWRPYSDGEWVMTEYGWTFVSDDPWGWATWHYGNWMLTDDAGWVWAPGPTWAPAWVSWRYGGGYAAWAPLPPAGFHVAVYGYASPAWVCVPQAHFTDPVARFAVSVNMSARYVQAAQPLPSPVRAGGIGVNPGPRAEVVAAAIGHPVVAVSAHAVVGHGTASIARAPEAPKPPAAVAHAMQRSWAKSPGPTAARTGATAPGARPGSNRAATPSKARAQATPAARPNPPAPSHALPPSDAAAQKARAQQQVQANQQRAAATQERKEERVGGMSNAEPPPDEERGSAERANDERTTNERANDERANPTRPDESPAQHAASSRPAARAAPKAPAAHPAPHPAGRAGGKHH